MLANWVSVTAAFVILRREATKDLSRLLRSTGAIETLCSLVVAQNDRSAKVRLQN
jgi:hypothetical protein